MIDLKIAKPCDQSWTAMKGDERVRHCQRCDHSVYNIAEMTEKEIEDLIRRTEGKFCARIYRRTDNRIMTKDCPKGVAAVRRRVALAVAAAFASVFYGFSALRGRPTTFPEAREAVSQKVPVRKVIEVIDPPHRAVMGDAEFASVRVGEASAVDVRWTDVGVIPKRKK